MTTTLKYWVAIFGGDFHILNCKIVLRHYTPTAHIVKTDSRGKFLAEENALFDLIEDAEIYAESLRSEIIDKAKAMRIMKD